MRIAGLVFAAALLGSLPHAASAQPTDLKAQAGKDWKHKPTGVKLPAQLAGLQRQSVKGLAGPETDVVGDYWSADGSETVTIFLFRNVSGSVPVWFDRARSLILLLPQKYPDPRSLGIRSLTLRGQQPVTGLMEIFATSGKYRSTGLMVLPVNGFYAKIRASSVARDAAGLEQLMLAAVNSIDWRSRQKEVAATPIADCPTALPARPPAKVAALNKDDQMTSALIGALVAGVGSTAAATTSITYCREPGPTQISYGIYRPEASTDRYMMALLDAGRAILVGSSDLSAILSELKTAPRVSVSHVELDRTVVYGDFESLPLPEQVVEMVEKTNPLSVSHTWGKKDKNITIISGD